MTTTQAQIEQPARDQPVTSLELFFDLVLVFALRRVTGFISSVPTRTRLVEGVDALVFGTTYLLVRMLHLGSCLVVARGDPGLRGLVARHAVPVVPAALFVAARSSTAPHVRCAGYWQAVRVA